MSDQTSDILAPDEYVLIRGERDTVLVREMNWKQFKLYFKGLSAHVGEFMKVDDKGNYRFHQEKLVQVVMTAFGDELVMAATDLQRDQIDALSGRDYFALLQTAVRLNMHPELIDGVKNVGTRLLTLVKGAGLSQPPSTTS